MPEFFDVLSKRMVLKARTSRRAPLMKKVHRKKNILSTINYTTYPRTTPELKTMAKYSVVRRDRNKPFRDGRESS